MQSFPKPSQILINYMNQVCQVKSHKFPGDFPDISIYPPISYHRCGNLYGFPREGKKHLHVVFFPHLFELQECKSLRNVPLGSFEPGSIGLEGCGTWRNPSSLVKQLGHGTYLDPEESGDFTGFWWWEHMGTMVILFGFDETKLRFHGFKWWLNDDFMG